MGKMERNDNGELDGGPETQTCDGTNLMSEDITQAVQGIITKEQRELIEKLDKESSVRTLENPLIRNFFYCLCVAVTLYHIVTSSTPWIPTVHKHRAIHVAMMLTLGFIMYPFNSKCSYKKVAWYDWVLIAISVAVPIYVCSEYMGILERTGNPNLNDTIMATLLVVIILEGTRRMSGWALPILSVIFIAYGLYGRNLPGMFTHRGYTWAQLSNQLFPNTEGIYGSSVSVAASFIYLL
jgi:TRAP-type uncharacterized transport system fused permease subunit